MALLTIRPLQSEDVDRVVQYWADASPADLARMGVDPSKVASSEPMRRSLEAWLTTAPEQWTSFPTIWQVDGSPVGYSTLKDLRSGHDGSLHLHVWAKDMRGKGYGAPLFCLTVVSLYERFHLKTIRCEPKADNPFPNGMLRKVGFALERTYVGASSELAAVCALASYRIDRSLADRYLAKFPRTAEGAIVA